MKNPKVNLAVTALYGSVLLLVAITWVPPIGANHFRCG
jgi:hypothetical protein